MFKKLFSSLLMVQQNTLVCLTTAIFFWEALNLLLRPGALHIGWANGLIHKYDMGKKSFADDKCSCVFYCAFSDEKRKLC
jgi:hypothetical protein